jgi:hypothetical protein
MADIRAILSNSDFSLPATWFGGVVPGPGDVAFANGNTVLVSDARTVQAISNAAGTSIVVGGTFSLLNGCNLTCTNANGVIQGGTTTSCITTPGLGVGSSASLAASVTHTTVTSSNSITFSSAGTLSVIGNLTGANSGSATTALLVSGGGTLNITGGNITGGVGGSGGAMSITGPASVFITVGNISGGAVSNQPGVTMTNGTVTVNGNVTGGAAPGIINNGSGTLTVNGICQSSATSPAIGAGSATQITRLSGPFLLGASGNINPVQAQSWRWAPTQIPTYYEIVASNGSTKRNLFTSDNIPTANYPATGSVRSGVVYGPSNENTGTLTVPAAASVALGVAVDNTVGTAVLTAASVQAALTAQGLTTTRADYLDQIPNRASVDQVASIVQGATSA